MPTEFDPHWTAGSAYNALTILKSINAVASKLHAYLLYLILQHSLRAVL